MPSVQQFVPTVQKVHLKVQLGKVPATHAQRASFQMEVLQPAKIAQLVSSLRRLAPLSVTDAQRAKSLLQLVRMHAITVQQGSTSQASGRQLAKIVRRARSLKLEQRNVQTAKEAKSQTVLVRQAAITALLAKRVTMVRGCARHVRLELHLQKARPLVPHVQQAKEHLQAPLHAMTVLLVDFRLPMQPRARLVRSENMPMTRAQLPARTVLLESMHLQDSPIVPTAMLDDTLVQQLLCALHVHKEKCQQLVLHHVQNVLPESMS